MCFFQIVAVMYVAQLIIDACLVVVCQQWWMTELYTWVEISGWQRRLVVARLSLGRRLISWSRSCWLDFTTASMTIVIAVTWFHAFNESKPFALWSTFTITLDWRHSVISLCMHCLGHQTDPAIDLFGDMKWSMTVWRSLIDKCNFFTNLFLKWLDVTKIKQSFYISCVWPLSRCEKYHSDVIKRPRTPWLSPTRWRHHASQQRSDVGIANTALVGPGALFKQDSHYCVYGCIFAYVWYFIAI